VIVSGYRKIGFEEAEAEAFTAVWLAEGDRLSAD
jgi:hypothetical protein